MNLPKNNLTQDSKKIDLEEYKEVFAEVFKRRETEFLNRLREEMKLYTDNQVNHLGIWLSQVIDKSRKDKQTEFMVERIPQIRGEAEATLKEMEKRIEWRKRTEAIEGELWVDLTMSNYVQPIMMVCRKMLLIFEELDTLKVNEFIEERRNIIKEQTI